MAPLCQVQRLGIIDYQTAWDLQERLAGEIARGQHPATLLLMEHPHTYTFGRRGHIENLLWDEDERRRRGVQVLWVDRGGDVTYHGPGQLVGYPLLVLAPGGLMPEQEPGQPQRLPRADYIGYLRRLEETLILALARLGLPSGRVPGRTGVWTQASETEAAAKVAAIGVKVDARGVSRHGFALNVTPQMMYWEGIIGCGLENAPVTCLADWLDPVPSMTEVSDAVVTAFGETFHYRMQEGAA